MIRKEEISQKINDIKENEKFWVITTFLFTMLLKIISNLGHINIDLIRDEIGYLALPVTLAGLNWDSVIQLSSYYGFGYIVIFTPLFKWIDNPYVIWSTIRLVNILGLSAVSVGLFYLQKNVFKRKDGFWNCMVAVFVCQFASISWSQEYSIFVSTWVAVCIFWSAYKTSGKKKIYMSTLLAFWLCYSMTLHERNMVLAITVFIMIVFYMLVFRNSIVSLIAFIPSFVVFYNIEQCIKKNVLELLYYRAQNGETIDNSEVFSKNMFWFLEDICSSAKVMGSVIISNLYTLTNRTYGLALLAGVLLIIQLMRLFKKEIRKGENEEKNPELFFLLFSLLTTVIIMAGLAVKWGNGISSNEFYNYKAMTYFRYYGAYIYPAIFAFLSSKENKCKKIYIVSIISYICIYACMKLQLIENIVYAVQYSDPPININGAWVDWYENIVDPYMAALISLFCVLIIMLLFWKFEHKHVLAVWVVGLMITAITNATMPQFTSYSVEGTYRVYNELGNELPDVIYVNPIPQEMSYTLQYMLMDTTLVRYKPDADVEEFVYFTTSKDPAITAPDVRRLDLNVYEYLYVRGEELQECFRQAGYEFEETIETESLWLLNELEIAENFKIVVENYPGLYDSINEAGYDVHIDNIYMQREEPTIMFFKILWIPVDQFYAEGYYIHEMDDGYVATNDASIFMEIEKAYTE